MQVDDDERDAFVQAQLLLAIGQLEQVGEHAANGRQLEEHVQWQERFSLFLGEKQRIRRADRQEYLRADARLGRKLLARSARSTGRTRSAMSSAWHSESRARYAAVRHAECTRSNLGGWERWGGGEREGFIYKIGFEAAY